MGRVRPGKGWWKARLKAKWYVPWLPSKWVSESQRLLLVFLYFNGGSVSVGKVHNFLSLIGVRVKKDVYGRLLELGYVSLDSDKLALTRKGFKLVEWLFYVAYDKDRSFQQLEAISNCEDDVDKLRELFVARRYV